MSGANHGPFILATPEDLRALLAEELDRRLGPVLSALAGRREPVGHTAEAAAMLSRAELARLLGVNARTLRRMVLSGDLPKPVQLGRRAIRWSRPQIDSWLAARRNES